MRFLWSTARKDWARQRRDQAAFVLWLGIPIIVGFVITLATGGKEGPKPQAHVLIADLDDSFLSGFLVGALTQEQAGGFVRAESVALPDGRNRIGDGEASALLVIPEGFGEALLLEEPTELELVTNPSQRILPGIVEESLSMFTDGVFYLHRLIGDDLRAIAEGPPDSATTFPDAWIADLSIRINGIVAGLEDTLFPPVIQVAFAPADEEPIDGSATGEVEGEAATTADAPAADEPEPSMALLFLPGLLFMSLLFIAQGVAADLWQEREQRTLRRVIVSPRGAHEFLAGKIVAGSGVMFLVTLVALVVGFAYFGIPPSRLPMAALWGTFSGGVLLVMMMLLQLLSSSPRAGQVFTMAIVFPLIMLGGSFFPFEAMPAWMRAVGAWTPNGWALLHLKHILLGTSSAASLGIAFVGLLTVAGVLFLLAGARLSSSFARE